MRPKTFLLALSAVVLIGNVSCALFTESSNDPSATNDTIEEKDIELPIEEKDIESLPDMIPFAVKEDHLENLKDDDKFEIEQPFSRARNGKLVFVKNFDGKSDLCTISLEIEGDEPRPMHINENDLIMGKDKTKNVVFSMPKFSPDGSKIAFTRYGKKQDVDTIYTMDQDGQNLNEIVEGKYPCFTPDGQRIVASNSSNQVFTCDLDGGDIKILVQNNFNGHFLDAISRINFTPDGKGIYFIQYNSITRRSDLKIADAVTGKIFKIVYGVERASFSPDGKYIVFIHSNWYLFILHLESGRIFENLPVGRLIDVIWSPDGRSIFYSDYLSCGFIDISFVDGRPVLNRNMGKYIRGATQFAWQSLPI